MKTTAYRGGRVVAITGGARGIGMATGAAFLRAGARVALGDIDAALVEKTAAELRESTGGVVCGLPLDVTDRTSFSSFLDAAEDRLGPLDVLVNNAGIMPTGSFTAEADAMTDRIVAINLCGAPRIETRRAPDGRARRPHRERRFARRGDRVSGTGHLLRNQARRRRVLRSTPS